MDRQQQRGMDHDFIGINRNRKWIGDLFSGGKPDL
jgi:hypothetical protein